MSSTCEAPLAPVRSRAAALKAETDAAIAGYEQAMAEARSQAQDHVRAISADVKAIADKKTAEVTAAVGEQITAAEVRIAKARNWRSPIRTSDSRNASSS
jgi:F0F1-type ATP synthase membrane subunit b/b'